MLNVHSVSEVNILHDSWGVLRVSIGCQDPCITKKKQKKQKHPCGQNAASAFCDVDWCDGNRPLTVPTGSLAWRQVLDLLFTDLKIVHTCAHSSLGTPWRPCGAVSKWRLREVLKNAPLSRCPIPARTTKVHSGSGPSDWSESPASTAMTGRRWLEFLEFKPRQKI